MAVDAMAPYVASGINSHDVDLAKPRQLGPRTLRVKFGENDS